MSSKSLVFISISEFPSIEASGIYTDLIREFVKNNWKVSVFYGTTDKNRIGEEVDGFVSLVPVIIRKYEKTSIVRKGLSILNFDRAFLNVIKNSQIHSVDLLLYATPPITLTRTINWVKITFSARTYLLLKDIFPQNALDLGILSKFNPLYTYFSFIEKKLYALSDTIGCMSLANLSYINSKNHIAVNKLEVNPNSIDISRIAFKGINKAEVLSKYGISVESKIIVYGGNLGLPQGIPFLLNLMEFTLLRRQDIVWVVAGSGTHAFMFENCQLENVHFLGNLSNEEFNTLTAISDVGLISLDSRFTIPNFPSRLLSYLSNSIPVLCLVDRVTDIGTMAEKHRFGLSALHGDLQGCYNAMTRLVDDVDLNMFGKRGFDYLLSNFSSKLSYELIVKDLSLK